ncbi:MAG: outer membrane protein assembly factor BamB [Verrucomicrobiales bacterium]|jgi:outer membrane protein assembly factor BamB
MRVFTILCVLLLLALAGGIAWLHATESFASTVATAMGVVIGLVIIALWAVFRFGGSAKSKILTLIVGVIAVAATTQLFRYNGSFDGSSLPQFTWRWAPEKGQGLDDLSGLAPQNEAEIDDWVPAGVYQDFPGYLGADRTGIVRGVTLETDWEANPPEELWRIPMGLGWSGFAVKGRYAITQEQRDDQELVTCYNFATGEAIWAHRNTARFSEGMGGDGPRATPQIEGNLVYALGATGILDCLELATGKLVWSRQVLEENSAENPMYGKSGSPLMTGAHVVVTGGNSGPLLIAYDKLTGEPAWTNGSDAAGFASPVLVTLAGRSQIVSVNAKSVTGHDPDSGDEIWRWQWPGSMPKPAQPQIIDGEQVLLTASYGLGCHLLHIRPADVDASKCTVEVIWESNRLKTKFSNACVYKGFAYGLDEGRFACISLEDGERQWKDGRYGYGQNLLVGDVFLVQAERGNVILVNANPEKHEELATLEALASNTKSWNTPTLAGSYLLVRNDVEAACYRLPVKDSKKSAE